jgi:hypothetical protein
VVGTFAVLRRRALISDALSHATLLALLAVLLEATDVACRCCTPAPPSPAWGVLVVQGGADHAAARGRRDGRGAKRVLRSRLRPAQLHQTLGTGAEGGIAKCIYARPRR